MQQVDVSPLDALDYEIPCKNDENVATWMILIPCGCEAFNCRGCKVKNEVISIVHEFICCEICGEQNMKSSLIRFEKL